MGGREDIRTEADGGRKEEKKFVGGEGGGNPYMEGQAREAIHQPGSNPRRSALLIGRAWTVRPTREKNLHSAGSFLIGSLSRSGFAGLFSLVLYRPSRYPLWQIFFFMFWSHARETGHQYSMLTRCHAGLLTVNGSGRTPRSAMIGFIIAHFVALIGPLAYENVYPG